MWTGKHTAILGLASAISLGVGGASGWFLAKRQMQANYDEILKGEIDQVKAYYANLNKSDPEDLAASLVEEGAPQKHPYDTTSDEVPKEVLERIAETIQAAQIKVDEEAKPLAEQEHNAFESPAPAWVQEDEELERRNGVPYIISHDEFYENQWEFEEGNLTYYEADDVVADSRDEPINNQYEILGELTLEKFGHGSPDPNIVYVCNEKMEMIFEVCRSTKSFAEDVMGLQHSDTRMPRRGRKLGE